MDNLRLILLFIGCLVVLGIYLWEVFSNGTPKKRTDILNAVDESPDIPVSPVNTNQVATDNYSNDALADIGSLLTESRNQSVSIDETSKLLNISDNNLEPKISIDDKPDEELPLEMSVKDFEASMSDEEEPDIFAAIEEELYEQGELDEVEGYPNTNDGQHAYEQEEVDLPESNQNNEDILVLYITSPSHISFNGLSISKAAEEVGMIYGHMNIFHHFGPGKLHSGQPLFSISNMHEPGSFDLGRMSDLKTKGLAAFMYSPASIDASVVFELFLNTIQRLAELLGGTVRTSDNEILNNAAINSLREKAESLSVK
jgi:cell division protein ZipA